MSIVSLCSIVYSEQSNTTLHCIIFHHLNNTLHCSYSTYVAWMQARHLHEGNTNKGESEQDTEWASQNKTRTLNLKGAWMWFEYEKSDMDQKTVNCKLCCRLVPTNTTILFYHLHKIHVRQYRERLRMRGCSKQTSDSEAASGFCLRNSIWQKIMRLEGCCCNLQ